MPYVPSGSLKVDRCISCKGVWLDASEIEKIRNLLAKKLVWRRRTRRLDETVRREQEKWEAYTAQVAEEETAHHMSGLEWWFMFLTRLPVEVHNPVRGFPEATIAIVVANVVVFVLQLMGINTAALAFVPGDFLRFINTYTVVTSLFVHANSIHLTANLYFFYTFGDNVEDFLGAGGFTLLYLAAGILGNLTHFASNVHSVIPAVGASGAISGIFAAYILLYPRRRIYFLVIIWPVKVRAIWYGLAWISLQILYVAFASSTRVALWAHIGGFTAGLVLVEVYLHFKHLDPATASA